MPFVDDLNRILRDHEGYTGDGHGGNGALPVGDRSTARRPIWKRDLREIMTLLAQTMGDPSALQEILDELDGKAPLQNSGKLFVSRASAVAAGQSALVSSLGLIVTIESDQVVFRAPGFVGDDPLFETSPQWGAAARVPRMSQMNALLASLQGLAEDQAAGDAALASAIVTEAQIRQQADLSNYLRLQDEFRAGLQTKASTSELALEVATRKADVARLEKLSSKGQAIRPGDYPLAYVQSNGQDLPANFVTRPTTGKMFLQRGAGIIRMREPVALSTDVLDIVFRVWRIENSNDPSGDAVELVAMWLDQNKSVIGESVLYSIPDLRVADGRREASVRVSRLAVEDVISPPSGAAYIVVQARIFGSDGQTAIEELRADNITDLHLVQPADLSQVIADAVAATQAAAGAAMVATETLPTMAEVADYVRPSDVGVITLTGDAQAYDGRGGQWAYDPSDTTSPANPPYLLVGADGARWRQVRADRSELIAAAYGLIGDGATLNEVGHIPVGSNLDLGGRTYVVNNIPQHFQSYNGAWKVGSEVYAARQKPLDHPLAVDLRAVKSDGRTHFWGFGIVHDATTDITCAFWNRAHRHEPSVGGPLICARSYDRGASFNRESTIYSVTDRDVADGAFGQMDNGRIGGVIATREVSGSNYRTAFVYSDNGGEAWQTIEDIVDPGLGIFPYGRLHSYSGGHIAFGYFANNIVYVRSEDNGITWTRGIALAGNGLVPTPTEPSVVQIGGGRWLMFIRPQTGNLITAQSADGLNWTNVTDTGIPLGPNPVYAIYEGGNVYVYLAARNIQKLREQRSALMMVKANADDLYNGADLKSYGLRFALDMESSMLAYICETKIGDDYVWIATAAESETGSAYGAPSTVYVGSTRPRPAASPAMVKEARRNRNLLRNQNFHHWTRATEFIDQTTRRPVADQWVVEPSGATYTCERVDVPARFARLMPHGPRYGMKIATSISNDFLSLRQDHHGEDALWAVSGAVLTFSIWGRGQIPEAATSPYAQIQFNYGSGGSPTETISGGKLAVADFDGIWFATGRMRTPDLNDKAIGVDPFFRFLIGSQANAPWNVEIYGIKLEIGEAATPLEAVDHLSERLVLDHFIERKTFAQYDVIGLANFLTTNTTSTTLNYAKKAKKPTLMLPAANVFGLRGPNVITPNSVISTEIGINAASLQAVYDDLVGDHGGLLRCIDPDGLSILIDAETWAA